MSTRLDEIDADVELRGTMARIKPAELRQLVAVARAAERVREAHEALCDAVRDDAERREQVRLQERVLREWAEYDRVRKPLLAEKEG
jgi:hypothetical protein